MEPEDPTGLDQHPDDPRSSAFSEPDDPRSSGLVLYPNEVLGLPHDRTEESWSSVAGASDPRTPCPSSDPKTRPEHEAPMPSSHVDDSTRMRVRDVGVDEVDGVSMSGVTGIDADDSVVHHTDVTETFHQGMLSYRLLPLRLAHELLTTKVMTRIRSSRSNNRKELRRECGVDINTENLSYLTDFRTRGLSDELKHSVTNSSGMTLIAGFPSKDDHFEYRFFFAEISERTVKADCIDLVKTRWERRVKPTMPKVSKEFLTAMHKELSSGNGNWKRSFSRKRIERALSAEILPRKVLGRAQARLSLCEQIALEAAAKARGSPGTGAPRVAMPTTSTPPATSTRARTSRPSAPKTALPPPSLGDVAEFRRLSAERARISSGKGKSVDHVTPSKRQSADAFPAAAVGGEASASGGDGLLRDEAYSVMKSRYSELSLLFDRLVGDYDEDVLSRGSELSAANEANAALQSRLNETVERNEALERDAQRVKKDYEDKLSKLKSRIDAVVGEARDKVTRSFAEQTCEVAGLLAEIGGKVQNDMLNLTEIDANLEFIGLLQGSDPPDLPTEVKTLRRRRHPIYDAHDVLADLLASVRRVLEIPTVPAGAVETSAAVDDDVEVSDEDNVEATGDEGAED
ncbi:hypothetical protein AALP_AA6G092100 [Arabis alpina]|uniref:Uncharacterized protein n=1 Tax=Arabis alpina TaxID=50452 RepID=A0A087GN28_ARAAL|nr:hypothetical protein AALP_AA6G092100 [Arabis alpina]